MNDIDDRMMDGHNNNDGSLISLTDFTNLGT